MNQVKWFVGSPLGRDRGQGLKDLTVNGTVDKRSALIVGVMDLLDATLRSIKFPYCSKPCICLNLAHAFEHFWRIFEVTLKLTSKRPAHSRKKRL